MSPMRFISWYELYKRILAVKGSIVELGVGTGGHINSLLCLRRALEPDNIEGRKIIGFDTFGGGIPHESEEDKVIAVRFEGSKVGGSDAGDTRDNIFGVAREFDLYDRTDQNASEGPNIELVQGDIVDTLPTFLETHPHLVVALLSLDLDVYTPTKIGLDLLLPRMPKGGIVVFDELDSLRWPGETIAADRSVGISEMRLKRFSWERDQSYWVIE